MTNDIKKARRRAERGRWSAKRKADVVLRLLRGEELDLVSRELGVKATTLAQWRDRFLASGESGLRARDEDDDRDLEVKRLQAKVGEVTMANELLQEKCRQLEDGLHPPMRRSRP